MPSPYQLHVLEWENCTRCCYHEQRKRVVLGKGVLPADIFFIGEAPGDSEDVAGDPFVGQSGRHLDGIIAKSGAAKYRCAFSNLTGCIPKTVDGELEDPDPECVEICSPRLIEIVEIANPKLIVLVGKQSAEWMDPTYKHCIKAGVGIPRVEITHPAAIARAPYVQRSLMAQKCVITIRKAIEQYIEGRDADSED